MAGKPWGMPVTATVQGQVHVPAQPPNQALLLWLWVLLRYLQPALALHLQAAEPPLSVRLGRALTSLLGTHTDAAAHLRLIELCLFSIPAEVAFPRAHTPVLLVCLLARAKESLLAMPPDSLLPAFTQLRLSTPREAQLHEEACAAPLTRRRFVPQL